MPAAAVAAEAGAEAEAEAEACRQAKVYIPIQKKRTNDCVELPLYEQPPTREPGCRENNMANVEHLISAASERRGKEECLSARESG